MGLIETEISLEHEEIEQAVEAPLLEEEKTLKMPVLKQKFHWQ